MATVHKDAGKITPLRRAPDLACADLCPGSGGRSSATVYMCGTAASSGLQIVRGDTNKFWSFYSVASDTTVPSL